MIGLIDDLLWWHAIVGLLGLAPIHHEERKFRMEECRIAIKDCQKLAAKVVISHRPDRLWRRLRELPGARSGA